MLQSDDYFSQLKLASKLVKNLSKPLNFRYKVGDFLHPTHNQ